MADHLQSIGYILKREKLASLASELTHPELLLESLDPYPGFYEQYFVPTSAKDQRTSSVYMVIRNFDVCHEDDFVRMTMHVKRDHQLQFDAALSSIMLFNQPASAIRVNMDDHTKLAELVSHYKQVGVQFLSSKLVKPYQSLIKIRRFFDLEVLGDGIFLDADKPDNYYLRIPSFLSWDEFERVTISIRNNWEHKTYDAAQAAIYEKAGVVELVRIYDRNTHIDKLLYLKQRYIGEAGRK